MFIVCYDDQMGGKWRHLVLTNVFWSLQLIWTYLLMPYNEGFCDGIIDLTKVALKVSEKIIIWNLRCHLYLCYSWYLHTHGYIQTGSCHQHDYKFPGHHDNYIVLDNCLPMYSQYMLEGQMRPIHINTLHTVPIWIKYVISPYYFDNGYNTILTVVLRGIVNLFEHTLFVRWIVV